MACHTFWSWAIVLAVLLLAVAWGVRRLTRRKIIRLNMANMTHDPIYATFLNDGEWKSFSERHQEFLKLFPNLIKAMNIAFVRKQTGPSIDVVILSLGRLCLEEFMEILLLCGHGYGVAATRTIRGMYERAVTAEYLHDNPGEVEAFLNYHHVSEYKLLKQIQTTMGNNVLSPAQTKQIEENYQNHKAQFMVTDCKKCETFGVNHNWSKLDFVSMAGKTSLGKLIVPDYYLPTKQIHSTIGAVFSRLEFGQDEGLVFQEAAQREEADEALMAAHVLMLSVLELQKNHFNLDVLDTPLQTCKADLDTIWRKTPASEERSNPGSSAS